MDVPSYILWKDAVLRQVLLGFDRSGVLLLGAWLYMSEKAGTTVGPQNIQTRIAERARQCASCFECHFDN